MSSGLPDVYRSDARPGQHCARNAPCARRGRRRESATAVPEEQWRRAYGRCAPIALLVNRASALGQSVSDQLARSGIPALHRSVAAFCSGAALLCAAARGEAARRDPCTARPPKAGPRVSAVLRVPSAARAAPSAPAAPTWATACAASSCLARFEPMGGTKAECGRGGGPQCDSTPRGSMPCSGRAAAVRTSCCGSPTVGGHVVWMVRACRVDVARNGYVPRGAAGLTRCWYPADNLRGTVPSYLGPDGDRPPPTGRAPSGTGPATTGRRRIPRRMRCGAAPPPAASAARRRRCACRVARRVAAA